MCAQDIVLLTASDAVQALALEFFLPALLAIIQLKESMPINFFSRVCGSSVP